MKYQPELSRIHQRSDLNLLPESLRSLEAARHDQVLVDHREQLLVIIPGDTKYSLALTAKQLQREEYSLIVCDCILGWRVAPEILVTTDNP